RRQLDLRNFDLHLARVDRRQRALVVHDHGGEQDQQQHHDDLDDHERYGAPINLPGGDAFRAFAGDTVVVRIARRDRAQVEQGEAEGRMQERGLHVDAENDAEPDQVDAEMFGGGTEQGNDNEGEFEEVEEKGQHEHEGIDEDQEANLAARQRRQQIFDQDMSA